MIYKLVTFNCLLEVYSDFYFFFYGLKLRSKCESQKSKNLPVLYISNFLFTIYPGWDLALAMPRAAWVWYDLI